MNFTFTFFYFSAFYLFFLVLNKDKEHALHKKTIGLRAHPHMIFVLPRFNLIRPML